MRHLATGEEIAESLRAFCEGYNNNQRLKEMNRDWQRVVLVQASDSNDAFTLEVTGPELFFRPGAPENPDLKVVAASDILADLFWGDLNPTGPYMDGSLKLFGSEEDIVRLDIISLLIWGN